MIDLRRLEQRISPFFIQIALEEFRDKWKTEVWVRKDEDNGNLASGGSVTDVEHDCDIVTKVWINVCVLVWSC